MKIYSNHEESAQIGPKSMKFGRNPNFFPPFAGHVPTPKKIFFQFKTLFFFVLTLVKYYKSGKQAKSGVTDARRWAKQMLRFWDRQILLGTAKSGQNDGFTKGLSFISTDPRRISGLGLSQKGNICSSRLRTPDTPEFACFPR